MTRALLSGIVLCLTILVTTSTLAEQRIGIVYSQPTAKKFFDEFAYTQLFMAMQHQARMAGIPYDLLSEDDLTNANTIAKYNALVIPAMQYVTASKLSAIENAIDQAIINNGIGLIVAGDLMVYSEDGTILPGNPYSRMNRWLNIRYSSSMNNVAMTVRANDVNHPAMRNYAANEAILNYNPMWANSYQPFIGTTANILATLHVGNQTNNGVIALRVGSNRHVHFSNDQILADGNLVWSSLQWVVYGDNTPIGLTLSRDNSIFISRNDMDASMFASDLPLTEIPLLELLKTWRQNYNFVGSYYINLGNNPAAGEYTDWTISAPLYKNYITLGNEIGTHSWTHPYYTSRLSPTELEFEFNQSRAVINRQLGIEMLGAAIPGNPENLAVDQQIAQYFDYITGRSSVKGSGYPGAFGRQYPDSKSLYFSLNMSPDYTLVQWLGNTAAQAETIWRNEYNALLKHASQPIIHWLWHDYGPTISAAPNGPYTVEMFTNVIAMAFNQGSEFVTLEELQQRIRTFEATNLIVSGNNPITATINADTVGKFSLMVQSDQPINHVKDWYAYDNDQVFLPRNGGEFIIQLGSNPADVTHITTLPMRTELISLTGNGTELSFAISGEGDVSVQLNTALAANLTVQGTPDFSQNGTQLTLRFANQGIHNIDLTISTSINTPPIAFNQTVSTPQEEPISITLTAIDPNNDNLTFSVASNPINGQLTGIPPNLIYTPDIGFAGTDSFTFQTNDNLLDSNIATINMVINMVDVIDIIASPISNPVTNLTLDGDLTEWSELTSFGLDPDDISGANNQLDWLEGWLAHDASNLYIAYRNDGPISLSWAYTIYLDTDADKATGITYGNFFPIGTDYLLQGNVLYRYIGTGNDWNWQFVTTVSSGFNNDQAEFGIPHALIGNPTQIRLFFSGQNAAFIGGDTEDYYPDGVIDSANSAKEFFEYTIVSE